MILVDTSVWIDHLRSPLEALGPRLAAGEIFMHPFVMGELALGTIGDRQRTMADWGKLPQSPTADPYAVLDLIESAQLAGSGIGYVDAHLLAAAKMVGAALWTTNRRLRRAATRLGMDAAID